MKYLVFLLTITPFLNLFGANATLIEPLKKALAQASIYKKQYADLIELLQAEDKVVDQEHKKELRMRSLNGISQLIHDTELLLRALALYRSEEARLCAESLVPVVRFMKQKKLSLSLPLEQEGERSCAQDARDMLALYQLQSEVYDSFAQDPLPQEYRSAYDQIEFSYQEIVGQPYFSLSSLLKFLTIGNQQLAIFRTLILIKNGKETAGRKSPQVLIDQLELEIQNLIKKFLTSNSNSDLKALVNRDMQAFIKNFLISNTSRQLKAEVDCSCLSIKKLFRELFEIMSRETISVPLSSQGVSYSFQFTEKAVQEALSALPEKKHELVVEVKKTGEGYQHKLGLLDQFNCGKAQLYKGTAGLLRSVAGGVSTTQKISHDAANFVVSAGKSPDDVSGLFNLAGVPSGARTAITFLYWCRENSANPLGYLGNAFMKALLPESTYRSLLSGTSCNKGSLELLEQRIAQQLFRYIDTHKARLKVILQNNTGDIFAALNAFTGTTIRAAEELEKRSFNQIRSVIKPESLFFLLDDISTATREQEAPKGTFLALFEDASKKHRSLDNGQQENPVNLIRPLFIHTLLERKRFLQKQTLPEVVALDFCKEYLAETEPLKNYFTDLLADAQYQHEQLRVLGVPSHPLERLSDYRKLEKNTWDYWLPRYAQQRKDKKMAEQAELQVSLEQEKIAIQNQYEQLLKEKKTERNSWLARIKSFLLFKNTEEKLESVREKKEWYELPVSNERIDELTKERDDARNYLENYSAKQSFLSALFNYGRLCFLKKDLQKKESELAIALKNDSIERLSHEVVLCSNLIQALPLRADLSPKEEQLVKKIDKIPVTSAIFR
jgi:hypothetical protein